MDYVLGTELEFSVLFIYILFIIPFTSAIGMILAEIMPCLEQAGVHFGLAHQSQAISESLPISKPSRTFLQDNWAEKRQRDHSQDHGSKVVTPKVTDPKLQPGMSGPVLQFLVPSGTISLSPSGAAT